MDTLSSLMEVKLDIREKRCEWLPLRSWTRCYVKIEAIRCFPCYMKISFHKRSHSFTETDEEGLVFRINIPGLEVYPVSSRTKDFAYGLFWKQNRKDCRAYLSLDSKLNRDAHMKWIDCQIQNLEMYRKEILQSSRFSRVTMERSMTEDSELYQNMNKQDSNNEEIDNFRRVSSIYEEIIDFKERSKIPQRESVIYEEMKLRIPDSSSSPPPLPPRTRKNTECSSIQRSYTTPESEMVKKKWSLFENVFGKSKKSEAKRREKSIQLQPREIQLLKTKRNSFSSPDLSHLDASLDGNSVENGNLSFDVDTPANISASNSWELDNLNEVDEEIEVTSNYHHQPQEPNVSVQVKPNFHLNLEADLSTVNLIGSNCKLNDSSHLNVQQTSQYIQPSTTPPGYLEMRPGKGFDLKKVEELDRQLKNDYLYRLKYSYESPINFRRESDYNLPPPAEILYSNSPNSAVVVANEPHYVCMTKGKKVNTPSPPVAEMEFKTPAKSEPEPIYLPMNRNKRTSIDDKVASYFPNYDVVPIRKTPIARVTPLALKEKSNSINIPSRVSKRNGSLDDHHFNDNNNNNEDRNSESPKKYATLSRMIMTPPNSFESRNLSPPSSPSRSNKSSGSISPTSLKRFASLPRFKKIDFSPLRMKISSVLQRTQSNSSGC